MHRLPREFPHRDAISHIKHSLEPVMPNYELRFIHKLFGTVVLQIMAITLLVWALLPQPAQIDPVSMVAPADGAHASRPDRPG